MLEKFNALVCYVTDTTKTVEFYEKLGFKITKNKPGHGQANLGDFWIDFHDKDEEFKPEFQQEALKEPKGGGVYFMVKVRNIDKLYQDLISKDLKPSSEPRDWPWGNREFVIKDPDGYKIAFYDPKS